MPIDEDEWAQDVNDPQVHIFFGGQFMNFSSDKNSSEMKK